MVTSKKLFGIGIAVAAVAVVLDQISKSAVLAHFAGTPAPVVEVSSFFNLVLVWNHGISFGMFAAHRQPMLLMAVSVVIVIMLLIWLAKAASKIEALAIGCVIGGAIGNDIDRVRLDAVVDFLDFHAGLYHWPAFNIADSCIFIGVVLLCSGSMFSPKKHT